MGYNKEAHCILGLAVILISIALYYWAPPWTRFFWLITAAVGFFWAVVIGHLAFFIPDLLIGIVYIPIATPFRLFHYNFAKPVEIRKDNVPVIPGIFFSRGDEEILAYTRLAPQAIALVSKRGKQELIAYVEYRRTGIINSAINLLKTRSIPYVDLTEIAKYIEELSRQWPQLKQVNTESTQFPYELSDSIREIKKTYQQNGIAVLALSLFFEVKYDRYRYGEPENFFMRAFWGL